MNLPDLRGGKLCPGGGGRITPLAPPSMQPWPVIMYTILIHPHTHTAAIIYSLGVNFFISLFLRNPLKLMSNEILLFNHPLNKGALTITHGSDHS